MKYNSTFDFQLKRDYIIFYILINSILLVIVVYILFVLFFYKINKEMEIIRSYECGFDSNCKTRLTFSYRFFLISILFIVFDVEISLILPIPFLIMRDLGILIFIIFIFILVIGVIYEYYYGSLEWLDIIIKS